jgi:hypothetical protein
VYLDAHVEPETVPNVAIEIRPPDDGVGFEERGPKYGTPALTDLSVGFWRGSMTDVHLFEDPDNGSDLWVCFSGVGDGDVVVSGRLEG